MMPIFNLQYTRYSESDLIDIKTKRRKKCNDEQTKTNLKLWNNIRMKQVMLNRASKPLLLFLIFNFFIVLAEIPVGKTRVPGVKTTAKGI